MWISGSNQQNQSGIYGNLGVASTGNTPGSRDQSVGWFDGTGELWLYGGQGYDSAGTNGDLNDLWVFSITSGTWTWIGGNNIVPGGLGGRPGIYGTLGVAAANNWPGGRSDAASFVESTGGLWLFGGQGGGATTANQFLNDLWEYQPYAFTAAPTFSVPSGTYNAVQMVTISDTTTGAIIYYTNNGSTPTSSSTVYSDPVTVSLSETVEAVASSSGDLPSAVASAKYNIALPSFTVSGSAVSVSPGVTTGNASTVTLTPAGGLTGNVALTASVTSSPTGAKYPPTLSFGSTSPVSITGTTAGTATLTRKKHPRNSKRGPEVAQYNYEAAQVERSSLICVIRGWLSLPRSHHQRSRTQLSMGIHPSKPASRRHPCASL